MEEGLNVIVIDSFLINLIINGLNVIVNGLTVIVNALM